MSVTHAHAPSEPSESTGLDTKLWLLRAAKAVVVFIYAFVLVNLVLLTLGFFLRLLGASTDAEFTRWVYRSVDRIMEPFRGMFPSQAVTDQSVIDGSLLFAMIVYTIAGIALHALVVWLTDRIMALRRRQRIASAQGPQPSDPAAPYAVAPGPADYPASQLPSSAPAGRGPANT